MLGAIVGYGDAVTVPTTVGLCPHRVDALQTQLSTITSTGTLVPVEADSVHGKLMHCSDQLFGLVGRAHTRAFRRRAHEFGRTNLNPQIRAARAWWLQHLTTTPPREVPLRLEHMPLVVSYGDGEGGGGRSGFVICSERFGDSRPRVASVLTP